MMMRPLEPSIRIVGNRQKRRETIKKLGVTHPSGVE
jgi:hypothetical protein